MATPLSGRELLTQKLKPVRRLELLLWIPFGTLVLFRILLWGNGGFAAAAGIRILSSVTAVLLYVPLISWLSLWMGLRVRSQARAILLTSSLIGGWTLLPMMLPEHPGFYHSNLAQQFSWLRFSPASIFRYPPAGNALGLLTIAVHACIYAFLLVAIRRYVLSRADRLLGRLGENEQQPFVETENVPQPVGMGQEAAAAR